VLGPYLKGLRDAWGMRKDIRRRRRNPTAFVPPPGETRPLHVAMALPFPSWAKAGGAERHVHELASALVAQGVRVTVLTAAAPDLVPAPATLPYAAVVLDSARLRAARRARKRLPAGRTFAVAAQDREFNRLAERAAKDIGADVLHRHFSYEVPFRPSLPLVWTLHNGNLPRDDEDAETGAAAWDARRRERGLAHALHRPDGVICVSEHVRDSVLRRLGIDREVEVIPNACSDPAPTISKTEARRRLGIGSERVVLFIGHLWRHKRVMRLLPLLEQSDVHLVLIGTGDLEGELLLGRLDDEPKRLWLRAADVLALPSGTFEGNGIVLLEALRQGTPIYGTYGTWLASELRRFGKFGEDVRLALEAMKVDASRAIELVPTWEKVAERTSVIYRKVLDRSGTSK
jgi:glycosyltransferase involved in cell wall biosynthesis